MKTRNALKIIKKRVEKDPELKKAYFEEKRNYFKVSYKFSSSKK